MKTSTKLDKPDILAHLFPQLSTTISPCPPGATDVQLEVDKGIMLGCRYYSGAPEFPTLLFFPSAHETVSTFDPVAKVYNEHGMNVFFVSYRGQGNNSGSPTIEAMLTDAGRVVELARGWLSDNNFGGPFFIMGQSLGSVCAINIMYHSTEAAKGLIIESGICNTASYLEAIGANVSHLEFDEEEGFNNIQKIEKIKSPTLIFHGAKDALVTVSEAENLQASSGARSKQFFVIPGAEHHTLAQTGGELYFQTIKKYIDTVCGVNTWRRRRKSFKSSKGSEKS